MSYQIGIASSAGFGGLAHYDMLDRIRRFATGTGTAAVPVLVGTGNGTMTAVDTHPATITETWTITCTDITTPGAEIWSVSGSVSGAQAAATTGVAYSNALLDFLIAAGSTAWAVADAFTVATTIGALPAASRWLQLRYDTSIADRELILQGVGLSGADQIFIGFRAYQDATLDYYNLSVAGFTGYVSADLFTTQPGYRESGLCAHNLSINYWLSVNGQRIALAMKVGTPVYELGYVGKFLPYGTPGQYPYPIAVIGMLAGTPAVRYSDTTAAHSCGVKGNNVAQGALRDVMGNWQQFSCLPYAVDAALRRDSGGIYKAMKCVLYNTGQVWGELDGIRYIPGFNNVTENTTSLDTVAQVVIQDAFRTGIGDYFLLELA